MLLHGESITIGLTDHAGNVTVLQEGSQEYVTETIAPRKTFTLSVIDTQTLEDTPKGPPWVNLVLERHSSI